MITAQSLKERSQIINTVYLGNDLHQCIDEVAALRCHRDWEQLPHLGMLDEQVGVEEQRELVTVHRDMGEAFPQPDNVQQSRLVTPHLGDHYRCGWNPVSDPNQRVVRRHAAAGLLVRASWLG